MQNDLKVMVVDDNRHVRKLVATILETLSAEVVECEDPRHALRVYAAFRPDIVIVDFEMPGMSGAEFTQAVRKEEAAWGRRTAILLMTAHSDARRVTQAAQAGVDGLVAKPLSTGLLLQRVESALARAASLARSKAAAR